MIINRQHWAWATFVFVASVVAVLLYAGEFHPGRVPFAIHLPASLHRDVRETGRSVAGTPLGLIYGSVAAAIFVFAALIGLRRKRPTLKIGRLQTWLKGHIWLSVLTIPLVLLHCGFSSGSSMTQWFLIIYSIVMVSGFYGLALQHFLPRLMKERVPLETIFEQIPHLRNQMLESARELRKTLEPAPAPAPAPVVAVAAVTAESTAPAPVAEPSPFAPAVVEPPPDPSLAVLKEFLDEAGLPYLAAHRGDKMMLGTQRVSDDQFRLLKISVGADWQARVEQMQAWCDERRQLDLQTKLQHWLHGWLLLHIPFSVLLLVFTAWHIIAALFFY